MYVEGKLQTRQWTKPGEDTPRHFTEILLVPGGRVQFLERSNGNGDPAPAEASAPQSDNPGSDEIPF